VVNEKERSATKKERKQQMGTGNLGEKIRTYNWPNNRITDHRLGVSKFGLDSMLKGGDILEEFLEELVDLERDEKLKEILGEEAVKVRMG